MTSASAILNRAADLIRDTAAAATPGPWRVVDTDFAGYDAAVGKPGPPDYAYLNNVSNAWFGKSCGCCTEGTIPPGTARWIALMSPAVAPMIEKWLRDTASFFDEFADYWVTIPEQARDALALACAVLGEKEEQ